MSRRRCGHHALWALVLVVGLPALAEAQLFPNLATRKRRRAECCNEAPVFKLYRQEYYGYHPTCWRQFPAGWGCPSPAAPNSAEALKEIQAELDRQPVGGAQPPDGGMQGPGPGAPGPELGPQPPPRAPGEELPGVPRDRSPFELDRPGSRPGGTPAPGLGPVPPRGGNPADAPPPPGGSGGGPAPLPPPGESASTEPATPPGSPLTLLDVSERNAPEPTQASNADAAPLRSPALPDPSNPLANPGFSTPAPLDAPPAPRRGILGGLFDRFRIRR
jgi:hypothetical protein